MHDPHVHAREFSSLPALGPTEISNGRQTHNVSEYALLKDTSSNVSFPLRNSSVSPPPPPPPPNKQKKKKKKKNPQPMEPADIDWKNIESRFIRDDLYEHINAPKWLDLSAPDSPLDDDAAWFCRPDCRHPQTFEDFHKPSPSPKSTRLNAQSLKRRGAIMSVLLPPSPAKDPESGSKGKSKKFREDAENQDPNGNAVRPMKAALKEAVKSSAERKQAADEETRKAPRLRSTMSARNLFSGRDVLGQISEFCQEIKKLAVGREKSSAAAAVKVKEVRKEVKVEVEEERKVLVDKSNLRENDEPAKSSHEKFSVLKEVRACPPTPQRIPSPSNRRPRKAGTNNASSPLNKPLKSKERGILKELDQRKEEEKKPLVSKDDESNRATDVGHEGGEGSSMDMFWFFKPCTYLVK